MRFVGPSLAGIFAAISSGWFVFLLQVDVRSQGRAVWLASAALSALLGWVGVYGWVTMRPALMTLGAWGVIWGNFILWSAVVVPIAFAVVTTIVAVLRVRSSVDARRTAAG